MIKTNAFKTESKQLLDLMIHSIYSNKEIFLRELISNASDALDKRHFLAIQNEAYAYDTLAIDVVIDKDAGTLTISDNGIGMDEQDLDENLGTIAHSGSKKFMEQMAEAQEATSGDIIGQFGVGFYSSFIVADKVEVITRKPGEQALKWTSNGESEYTVEPSEREEIGTTIILHLRKDEEYQQFLDTQVIQGLVKKHSDYIKYPIFMDITKSEPVLDEDGNAKDGAYRDVIERTVVNSQVALWKRPKREITQEEYDNFFMSEFHEYQAPLHTIHSTVEGMMSYSALLFIPKTKSYDFYQQSYQKGLALYSKGVLIDARVEGLITEAFRFVRGLVDSSDISLNISREMLQQDKQVEKLAKSLESKIKSELTKMLKNDREKYDAFYEEFGLQLKYGLYENYGEKKELLKDLLMFQTSKSEGGYKTLQEYIDGMDAEQEHIYYVVGKSIEQIERLPQMEQVLANDVEVLYFTDDVDEFAIQVLTTYQEKSFQSISQGNFDFTTEDAKKALEEKQSESADLLTKMQELLAGKVQEVRLTSRLTNSAVCLVGGDGMSLDMEKILAQMPNAGDVKAERILELNPEHAMYQALQKVANDDAKLQLFANLLYKQALLIEGLPIDNPVEYAEEMSQLMVELTQ